MKFREYVLSSGKKIFAGKDSESNDLLVEEALPNDVLLHTVKPGSPFVNVGEEPKLYEVKEACIFCALKSQDWRDNKKDVRVHIFKKKDCYKTKNMLEGTWGVKRYNKTINVKKEVLENIEK